MKRITKLEELENELTRQQNKCVGEVYGSTEQKSRQWMAVGLLGIARAIVACKVAELDRAGENPQERKHDWECSSYSPHEGSSVYCCKKCGKMDTSYRERS